MEGNINGGASSSRHNGRQRKQHQRAMRFVEVGNDSGPAQHGSAREQERQQQQQKRQRQKKSQMKNYHDGRVAAAPTPTPIDATATNGKDKGAEQQQQQQQQENQISFRKELHGIACSQVLDAINVAFPHFNDRMTPIQHLTIPAVLRDGHNMAHDVMSRASTGSGKTVAFLVPCVDFLCRRLLQTATAGTAGGNARRRTAGAMVLCPTRELALQTAQVAQKLLDGVAKVDSRMALCAVVTIGGNNKNREAEELRGGCDLLIATPGRVLDHLNDGSLAIGRTDGSFRYLVLDEADQLLDIGFEHDLRKIIAMLPAQRSTMLFSATLTRKVEALVRVSLRMDRLISVGVDDDAAQQLKQNVSTLVQKYTVVPAEFRIAALLAILDAHKDNKIVVFVAIKAAVTFLGKVLQGVGVRNVRTLQGNHAQQRRTKTFNEFMSDPSPGVLVATDVAARGLDFPDVDLVVQCDLPEEWEQYFHRAGRTARAGRAGVALLMMTPRERDSCLGLLHLRLKEGADDDDESKRITEMALPASYTELADYQMRIASIVSSDPDLMRYTTGIPAQYSKVSQMHGKRIGLRHDTFDKNAVRNSFGLKSGRGHRDQSDPTRRRRTARGQSWRRGKSS